MFHLAGVPSYLVLAELAVKRVLHGRQPAPEHPAALRERASRVWWVRADRTFGHAGANSARSLCSDALQEASHNGFSGISTLMSGYYKHINFNSANYSVSN